MIVCVCHNVNEQKIKQVAKETGAVTIDELQMELNVCNTCETCKTYIQELLENIPSTTE